MHQSVNRYNLITLPQYRWAKYCKQRVCMSACLSLSAHVSPKPHVKISPNFLYIHVSLFNHTSQNRATRDFGSIWAVGLPICTPVRLPSLACTACHLCLPCATVRPSKPRPWHRDNPIIIYIDCADWTHCCFIFMSFSGPVWCVLLAWCKYHWLGKQQEFSSAVKHC